MAENTYTTQQLAAALAGIMPTEDPKPKPGIIPQGATVNFQSRSLKTDTINRDALLADRIGEIIGNNYDPFAKEGRAILNEINNKFYGPQFAQDLGTRIKVMMQDPNFKNMTPEQKLTQLFNSGTGTSDLDKYLTRAKSIGGNVARFYQGNPANPTR